MTDRPEYPRPVRIPFDRTLADEAIAQYQTASRAFRQGALKERAVASAHAPGARSLQ